MLPDAWAILPDTPFFPWGRWDNPAELSRRVYAGLRTLDERDVDIILCPLPPPSESTTAIRDRLLKAARPA
jgi:L-threonylcarbamoyladenylate synthase